LTIHAWPMWSLRHIHHLRMMSLLRSLMGHHWSGRTRARKSSATGLRRNWSIVMRVTLIWSLSEHWPLRIHLDIHVRSRRRLVSHDMAAHLRSRLRHILGTTRNLSHRHWVASWGHTVAGHRLPMDLYWLSSLSVIDVWHASTGRRMHR